MVNQAQMRIHLFIKLQLYARCFPLPKPWRLKDKQGAVLDGWGCRDRTEKAEQLHLQGFRVDLGSKHLGDLSSRSNKLPP